MRRLHQTLRHLRPLSAARPHARRPAAPCGAFAHDRRRLSTEAAPAAAEPHTFQAETLSLLDIVSNALYTEREVFLRELLSNASDALEKLRHRQVVGEPIGAPDVPLEIVIEADPEANTLTIADTGIGMGKDELILNLGTIARSGSKNFVNSLQQQRDGGGGAAAAGDAASGIIGQFGVGFYSAFMVGECVAVESRSALPDSDAHVWRSERSTGSYTIAALAEQPAAEGGSGGEGEGGSGGGAAPAVARGSKIVITLKADASEFADPERVRAVIKKYSNFVNFPIRVNGEVANSVQALWTMDKSELDDEKYTDFYRFISGQAHDTPLHHLHFRVDAPLDIKALLYVPSFHSEKFGMARLEPGVSLYSRKVLIEQSPEDLLPSWLRFVRGVVDSEDVPLAISREKAQDRALVRKIRDVVTRKLLRHWDGMLRRQPTEYRAFFHEFGVFLKEGACQDYENMEQIAKLLLFESSALDAGELTTLDEYLARASLGKDTIYYLSASTRALAEASPYYEAFKKAGREVLFVYNTIDDFTLTNIARYNNREIRSAEALKPEDLDTPESDAEPSAADESAPKTGRAAPLTEADADALCAWMREALADKLRDVKTTSRLVDSPAIVTQHESATLRRMMQQVDQAQSGAKVALPRQQLEVNPSHPVMIRLDALRRAGDTDAESRELAQLAAEQIFDYACIGAGLLDDGREMLPRMARLLEFALARDVAVNHHDDAGETAQEAQYSFKPPDEKQ